MWKALTIAALISIMTVGAWVQFRFGAERYRPVVVSNAAGLIMKPDSSEYFMEQLPSAIARIFLKVNSSLFINQPDTPGREPYFYIPLREWIRTETVDTAESPRKSKELVDWFVASGQRLEGINLSLYLVDSIVRENPATLCLLLSLKPIIEDTFVSNMQTVQLTEILQVLRNRKPDDLEEYETLISNARLRVYPTMTMCKENYPQLSPKGRGNA